MSLHIAKRFIRPLVLASAVIFFHISVASAGDSPGDTQQRMKELLTGTAPAHFIPQSAGREGSKATAQAVDSQEFIKQLLLGTTRPSAQTSKPSQAASASVDSQARAVAYRDSQAAMRHVLLGQSHASDAS